MIVEFAVYSTITGEILRTGHCPEEQTTCQAIEEGTDVYVGPADESTQKIDLTTLEPMDKTDDEITDYQYQQVCFKTPNLYDINAIDDDILNSRIESFYLKKVSALQWRIENYQKLRKAAYSHVSDRADAAVKIASGDANLIAEGEAQLAELNAHDLAVKERFPKE